ncbi:MAG: cytochrome c [Alphaproteobacteria bacterium]|nr:cytochrome c [Alphaproteobacteria bacterium]
MKLLVWLITACWAILLATDTRAQDAPNPLIGSHLYRSYCLVCHGADGKNPGSVASNLGLTPADLSSPQYQTKNVQDLAAVISGYRDQKGSDMPNWGMVLTATDLLDIAAYISNISRTDLRFIGDTRRGRAIFKRACVACHGKIGTGEGLLAHLFGISMMDFTQSENMKQIGDENLMSMIRDGKGDYMPSWKGILSDSEIADVAAYVRMLAR